MTAGRRCALAATVVLSTTLIIGCSHEAPEEVESETVVPVEAEPARPRYLRTEPGVGYRLVTE